MLKIAKEPALFIHTASKPIKPNLSDIICFFITKMRHLFLNDSPLFNFNHKNPLFEGIRLIVGLRKGFG
jgi:hypothetical protein